MAKETKRSGDPHGSSIIEPGLILPGQGHTASLAIYAALLDEKISEIIIKDPPTSHEDPMTPEFLGVLRVGDLPHNLALAYPRPITFVGEVPEAYSWTVDVYKKLGKADRIRVIKNIQDWPGLRPESS